MSSKYSSQKNLVAKQSGTDRRTNNNDNYSQKISFKPASSKKLSIEQFHGLAKLKHFSIQ